MDAEKIHHQVQQRFASVAKNPTCEKRLRLGRSSALELGYDPAVLDTLPQDAVASFAGVGNPLALAPVTEGMAVLDLGCGAGVDTMIAARTVGPKGKVFAIDMTDEMVEKARRSCAEAGCDNVEISKSLANDLALDDASVDVAISNGVVNLCPDKQGVLRELFRVLKPGGRMQLADMSLVDEINPELLERVGEWSD